jgi:YVTN family beta-propeller protein
LAGIAIVLSATLLISIAVYASEKATPHERSTYRSPYDVAFSPDGRLLAVSDRTAHSLLVIEAYSGKVLHEAALSGSAGCIAWAADSSRIFVTEYERSSVAEVSIADKRISRRLPVGPYPIGVAVAAKRRLLLAGNTGASDVSVIDLSTGAEKARIRCLREPFGIAITPDESIAVVSNLLPAGSAADPLTTAAVSLIDLNTMQRVADVPLPPNSTCVRRTVVSPDGRWAYTVHSLARTTLPATQLERGWVNTDAMSIIDLQTRQLYATVLLDTLTEGAADPWGLAISKDGAAMWVSLSGTHELARVDMASLHRALAGAPSTEMLARTGGNGIWARVKADPQHRQELANDLSALSASGLISRVALPGKGPRGLALSPDGRQLAAAMYFSGQVAQADAATGKVMAMIPIGAQSEPDEARRGEMIFHDATYTFQHWLSCATCHPNEGRVDGLNWDLPNDGVGNPKNNKSLLYAHLTPPSMWLGVRENMEVASAAGFRFAANQADPNDIKAVQAYIRSLKPLLSPYRLANGELSEKAARGKQIFESDRTGCSHCHSGELYTSLKKFNVGTQGSLDHPEEMYFDTPSLVELWRTAPYLHDGRAATVEEVLTKFNPGNRHGRTLHLSRRQLEDLLEYLLSL